MRALVRTLALGLAAVAMATAVGAPAVAQSKRPTIAVLAFEYGTVQQWWQGTWDIGEGISDLIVDELVNDGSFRVIERKRLDAILAEQNFSNSDRADPSAASVAKIGKALGVTLSADNRKSLYIPPGFAHGFCVVSPDAEVIYKTTEEYAPDHEFGIRWDDPALGIAWPVTAPTLSERDKRWPAFSQL